MKKARFLSILLALGMLFAISSSATAFAASTSDVTNKFAAAESRWPNGSVYQKTAEAGGCGECFGFARELFYYIFGVRMPQCAGVQDPAARFTSSPYSGNVTEIGHVGDNYSEAQLRTLLAKARPGDVVIASNYGHTSAYFNGRPTFHFVIVRSNYSDGSAINVYDANWVGYNKIATNRRWAASEIRRYKPYAVTLYRCTKSPYMNNNQTQRATISFNGVSGPGNVVKGNRASIYGTITSTNYNISTITATVTRRSDSKQMFNPKTVTVNSTSYKLQLSALDYALPFGTLDVGNYRITYSVRCTDGTTANKSVDFNIISNQSAVKTYTIRSTSGAKVRTGAGTSYSTTGALAKGSVVYYDSTKSANGYTWYHITKVDAKSGSWGTYVGKWVAGV